MQTELTLSFTDHLGTPASPLRKVLLESGLGDAIIGGGVEDELLQPQFSIGLKGVSEDDIPKVEELIMSSFRKLAEEGFSLMLRSIVSSSIPKFKISFFLCKFMFLFCLYFKG